MIETIENYFNCKAVLAARHKQVSWKCQFHIFPHVDQPVQWELSEPIYFDCSFGCESDDEPGDEPSDEPGDQWPDDHAWRGFSARMERARLFKKIKMLSKQVDSQRMKIIRLSCKLKAIREAQTDTGSTQPIAKEEIFGKLVSEMQELAEVPKRGRRFSELLLDISQLLFSLSPRSYRVLP